MVRKETTIDDITHADCIAGEVWHVNAKGIGCGDPFPPTAETVFTNCRFAEINRYVGRISYIKHMLAVLGPPSMGFYILSLYGKN